MTFVVQWRFKNLLIDFTSNVDLLPCCWSREDKLLSLRIKSTLAVQILALRYADTIRQIDRDVTVHEREINNPEVQVFSFVVHADAKLLSPWYDRFCMCLDNTPLLNWILVF